MPEIQFGTMPGYLMTQGPDREHTKKLKKDREQLSALRRDIKENYIPASKCKMFGVEQSTIDQWVEEGKLRRRLFKGKGYYHKEDVDKMF